MNIPNLSQPNQGLIPARQSIHRLFPRSNTALWLRSLKLDLAQLCCRRMLATRTTSTWRTRTRTGILSFQTMRRRRSTISSPLAERQVEGCNKRLFLGCVKLGKKKLRFLPTAGRRRQFLHPKFTQPGKSLIVQPCRVPFSYSDTLEDWKHNDIKSFSYLWSTRSKPLIESLSAHRWPSASCFCTPSTS